MPDAPPPWNIANAVTFARIVLVPVFAVALLIDGGGSPGWRLIATLVFVVAAASDRLDGYLARRGGLVTDLGKLLDPIADKLLVGTALILLAWPIHELPWWVPTIILVREFGITALRFAVLRYGVIAASKGGKLKTVLQIVAISLFLLPLDHLPWVVEALAWIVMSAALAVTVVTGAQYVAQAASMRRSALRGEGL